MNTLYKIRFMHSRLTRIRRLPRTVIRTLTISWISIALIILLIPRPGITVAPGGCTSTSGECGTVIDA